MGFPVTVCRMRCFQSGLQLPNCRELLPLRCACPCGSWVGWDLREVTGPARTSGTPPLFLIREPAGFGELGLNCL
jgi:hypothetical protein